MSSHLDALDPSRKRGEFRSDLVHLTCFTKYPLQPISSLPPYTNMPLEKARQGERAGKCDQGAGPRLAHRSARLWAHVTW